MPGAEAPIEVVSVDGPRGPITLELVRRRGLLRSRYEVWLRSRDGRARLWAGGSLGRARAELDRHAVRARARAAAVALPERSHVWLARLLDRPVPCGARDLALEDALTNLGFAPSEVRAAASAVVGIPQRLWDDPEGGPLDGVDPTRLARLLPALAAAGPTFGRWVRKVAVRPDLVARLSPEACMHLLSTDSDVAEWIAQAWAGRLVAAVGARGVLRLADGAARPRVRDLAAAWRRRIPWGRVAARSRKTIRARGFGGADTRTATSRWP